MKTYRFYRDGQHWFIDLPEYLDQGGSIGDLQMVDGADKMLDMIAGSEPTAILLISAQPFSGADKLTLTEVCDPLIGGGNYYLHSFEGKEVKQQMWLCQVTAFVFGRLPEEIFIKRASS